MLRKLVSIALLMTLSCGASALGLGNIELSSGLNQPFDARIELLSPTSTELDSLNIRVADVEAFQRAGIEWTLLLSSLRFEIQINATGADYIHITSREAIREPFLNFLLEASWSSGRLFREYTVLLDPPLYDPNARTVAVPVAPMSEPPAQVSSSTPTAVAVPETSTSSVPAAYSGNEFGPTSSTDTLWSIATRVRADDSVSVQQMMLALLRANPGAFIEGNINGLRQGQILRIPDRDNILTTNAGAALAEVRSQNAMWEQVRGSFAGSASQRPIGAGSQPASGSSVTSTSADSELRLVSPGSQTADSGQSAASFDSTGQDGADLAMANEQLESLSSENSDLRSRLEESEIIIQDLTRLLELKDDELASLQQQAVAEADVLIVENETSEAEPIAETTEIIDESIVSLELEDTDQGIPVAEPEEMVTEEVTIPVAVTTTQTESTSTGGGIVEQILSFVFTNIMLVGGALAALVLGIVGFMFVSKRKAASAEGDGAAAITEFPDFEAEAGGPDMSATAEDLAVEEAGEEADDVDKSPFIGEAESPELVADAAAPAVAEEADSAPEEEPEEDPLAEVNVFLAYEHFDQAEQFVRDAIEKEPDNLEFHNKLLEVFYSSGDRVKYEEEAKVLHELVGGEGPHWEMAEIMWQEISPNRALFSEPVDGESEVAGEDDTKGGGIVDLTADDNTEDDDGALDFDLGGGDESATDAASDEDMLDITSGADDVLDVTADSGTEGEEDLLDVTAAVGLDSVEESASGSDDEDMLDIGLDEGSSEGDGDILDISVVPGGDDDLLDVTAHSEIEADDGEELMDVTAAIDLPEGEGTALEAGETPAETDDNSLDFDVGGLEIEDSGDNALDVPEESSTDDNIIDFDAGSSEATDEGADGDLEISLNDDSDGGIELDMGSDDGEADGGLEISLDDDSDGGIELDMGSDDGEADGGLEISLDDDSGGGIELDDDISLDLTMDEDEGEAASPEIEMESTVKIPKDANDESSQEIEFESTMKIDQGSSLELDDDDDDDDDDDHTVFVPRTVDAGEQSAEDEVATKLDLAKAYVELGDKDSAKTILDEVIAEGNDSQRQQAEELKGQID